MSKTVTIDCFPESAQRYCESHAVVVIDVIRATTTAVTAVHLGRRCYAVPSIEAALPLAARLQDPLLAGELGGNMPYGFDLTNSPAHIAQRDYDATRPMILLSSSGTQLIHNAASAPALYIACLRNYSAAARHLVDRHRRVAVLGAGTRGEFREEDQLCCAWIARELVAAGYSASDEKTSEMIERWKDAAVETITASNSAEYLRNSGQLDDLDFILEHVDDLPAAYRVKQGEVLEVPLGSSPSGGRVLARGAVESGH